MRKTMIWLVATALIISNICVYAAPDTTTIIGDDLITFSGQASADEMVSITILNPGVTLEEFMASTQPESLVVCYRQEKVDNKGEFSTTFDIGGKSATYGVYVGAAESEEASYSLLKYVNKDENISAIADLQAAFDKSSEDEKGVAFSEVVSNMADALGVNLDLAAKSDLSLAAGIFFDSTEKANADTYEEAVSSIDKALAISLLNEGEITLLGDYAENFSLPKDVEKWLEEEFVTETAKSFIEQRMSKNTLNFDDFDKAATEAIGLGVIYSADGYGSVKKYLVENAKDLGINASKVTDDFAASIVGKPFDNISETGIDTYKKPESSLIQGSSKPSGGGSKVSGAGVGKTQTEAPQPLSNVQGNAFSDLEGYEWAEEAINALKIKGIVNGKSEGVFAPYDLVLREEFVKMMLSAITFEELYGEISFKDVDENDWYYDYVKKAFLSGVVNGISEISFGSGCNIIRQDMAVMCYNAMIKKGIITESDDVVLGFTDSGDIADYAKLAVSSLGSRGILNGDQNNTFHPNETATRAEAAQMIYNALRYVENK